MSFMCWKHPEYDAIRDGLPLKLSIEDEKDFLVYLRRPGYPIITYPRYT